MNTVEAGISAIAVEAVIIAKGITYAGLHIESIVVSLGSWGPILLGGVVGAAVVAAVAYGTVRLIQLAR